MYSITIYYLGQQAAINPISETSVFSVLVSPFKLSLLEPLHCRQLRRIVVL